MHVQETRSYDFNGKFSWADYSLSGLEDKKIVNFNLKDESGSYAENNSGNAGSYFVETVANQFYVKWHYQARNQVKTFVLDYTISNVINTYDDVAELYWKFVGETNPEWADSVSIEISLPREASFGEVKADHHVVFGDFADFFQFDFYRFDFFIGDFPFQGDENQVAYFFY